MRFVVWGSEKLFLGVFEINENFISYKKNQTILI
jgi:hypothetical protein